MTDYYWLNEETKAHFLALMRLYGLRYNGPHPISRNGYWFMKSSGLNNLFAGVSDNTLQRDLHALLATHGFTAIELPYDYNPFVALSVVSQE